MFEAEIGSYSKYLEVWRVLIYRDGVLYSVRFYGNKRKAERFVARVNRLFAQ
jgi:hypothetical protein